MAFISGVATKGAVDGQGLPVAPEFKASDPVNVPSAMLTTDAATLATDVGTMNTSRTAFEATLATLVADGAAPTQAHVTAANNAYTTLQGNLASVTADSATITADASTVAGKIGGNLQVIVDTSVITQRSHFLALMRKLIEQMQLQFSA